MYGISTANVTPAMTVMAPKAALVGSRGAGTGGEPTGGATATETRRGGAISKNGPLPGAALRRKAAPRAGPSSETACTKKENSTASTTATGTRKMLKVNA